MLSKLKNSYSDYGIFLGRTLREGEAEFPDYLAGFLISRELLNGLLAEHLEGNFGVIQRVTHDGPYYLSTAVRSQASFLENESRFCVEPGDDCAIYPRKVTCPNSQDEALRLVKQTLFAFRTCEALHGDRLQIIKNTWGEAAYHLLIASDVDDPGNGTVNLPKGDLDLCHRNLAIIRYFVQYSVENNWRWLVIADDDTMLGVSKMMDLLQCYDNYSDEDLLAIGQRYGYFVAGPNPRGFNFISGGGGIILNRHMAKRLNQECGCPRPDPMDRIDDVHLGECINQLRVPIVHTPRLHQRRPEDYDQNVLAHEDPVSFHKFYDIDPYKVYERYFKESDQVFKQLKLGVRDEL